MLLWYRFTTEGCCNFLPSRTETYSKNFLKQNYCSTQYSSEEQNEKKNISFDIQIEIVCLWIMLEIGVTVKFHVHAVYSFI